MITSRWESLVHACKDKRSQFSRVWNHSGIREAVMQGSAVEANLRLSAGILRDKLTQTEVELDAAQAEAARLRAAIDAAGAALAKGNTTAALSALLQAATTPTGKENRDEQH
jgi:hypothetical protein